MKVKKITEAEFYKLDISRRIITNDASHQYSVIDLGKNIGEYGLAWRSDIIQPIIRISEDNQSMWIGVDQKLAMVQLLDGQVNLIITLHTPILKLLSVDNLVAVLTELEVMLFNSNGLLRVSVGLPDLAENIIFENGNFLINLFDGSTLTLNPYKSTFDESLEDYLASQYKKITVYKCKMDVLLNKLEEDFLILDRQQKRIPSHRIFSFLNSITTFTLNNNKIMIGFSILLLLCLFGFYITYRLVPTNIIIAAFFLVLLPLLIGLQLMYLYYSLVVEYYNTRTPEAFVKKVMKDLEKFKDNYFSIYDFRNLKNNNLASFQENQIKIESIKNIIEKLKQDREVAQGKFTPFLPIFVLICIPFIQYFAVGKLNSNLSIPVLKTTFSTLGLLLGNWWISREYQNDISKFNNLLYILKEYLNHIKLA